MTVGRICSRAVVTVSPEEAIRTAALRMAENGVGALVVTALDGRVEGSGIVTDRDIAIRCVAGNLDPDGTPVSKVMTAPVGSVEESLPIGDALERSPGATEIRACLPRRG